MSSGSVAIEVACGTADRQEVLQLTVPVGTTLIEAVSQSGIMSLFPTLDLDNLPKGVFGEFQDDAYLVREGDRIEIYRNLQSDPKEARRQRARQG